MVRVKVPRLAAAAEQMCPAHARLQDERDWDQAENLVQTLVSKPDQDPIQQIRNYLEDPDASRRDRMRKLQNLVETAQRLKDCTLMKEARPRSESKSPRSRVKCIETLKWNEAPGAATWRTRVFPVGKQLERLSTLKPTGNLMPKRFPRYNYVHLLAEVMLFRLGVDLPEDPFADADAGANRGAKGVLMVATVACGERSRWEELQKLCEGLKMTSHELHNNAAAYGGEEREVVATGPEVFHMCSEPVEVKS
eukprot:g18112.t1